MTKALELVRLVSDPANPIAGSPFVLVVELKEAQPADVTVLVQKQRLVQGSGGESFLTPTGSTYFVLDPLPISVAAGSTTGHSKQIEVRTNATAPPGDAPVRFPELLLFRAGLERQPFSEGRWLVVRIEGLE
jgi:hypothetical protein